MNVEPYPRRLVVHRHRVDQWLHEPRRRWYRLVLLLIAFQCHAVAPVGPAAVAPVGVGGGTGAGSVCRMPLTAATLAFDAAKAASIFAGCTTEMPRSSAHAFSGGKIAVFLRASCESGPATMSDGTRCAASSASRSPRSTWAPERCSPSTCGSPCPTRRRRLHRVEAPRVRSVRF